MIDKAKLVVAVGLVRGCGRLLAGGFSAGGAHPRGDRRLLAAGAVAWWSEPGKQFAVFAGESVGSEESRPTRKETIQTTAAVFAFVVVMAVFLWLTDKALEWILYDLIMGWKK